MSGVCVNLSRAIDTTSFQVIVTPWSVALVFRTASKSVCIAVSNLDTKQCKVASSLAASERRSCSILRTKLAELSFAIGFIPKNRAFNWLLDSPNSYPTTSLKDSQFGNVWCW
jgi:hypothetical protein